ncbi:exported hypothetical protein [Nitrospina gracilis 3/211]|uniref:Lipoprotein n=1 Tax=Nitrospina gracilis (strain 3/211) TaxID=1266370 RepID=M1YVP7_NITG3|nr:MULTISPECIES: hypothetical protein [Nitrospina]MCF8722719.1 hypothetical protein [Nitrospina sp. Nb-3]CCQ89666.1 exported hypothetical protein [Nitrospina gracilis 3/211]
MIYRFLSFLFVLTLTGALVGCASPVKQGLDLGDPASIVDAPAPATVSQGEGIKVVAMPLKQSVELGEPVYLAVQVTNMRGEPVSLIGSLKPGEGLIEVYSIGANGEKKILLPLSASDFSGSTTLGPDQTAGEVFPIFFGANGWNFNEAGEYRISVQLEVPAEGGFSAFASEPAVIKVGSSKAGKALVSVDNPSNMEAGKFLLWRRGDHLEAGIKFLTTLSEQHPNSALSSYISAARVQSYSEPFANYTLKEVRAPDCEQANALRKTVNMNVLPENLLIEDFIAQAHCHAESQNWDAAREALDAGSRLASDRPEFRAYSRSIEEMQKRLSKYLK